MRLNQIVRITSDFKGGLVRCSIRQYPTGDFLLSSHYVSAWKSTDTVRRESLLVTPGGLDKSMLWQRYVSRT